MELGKFIEYTPYLYHLTSKQNARNIIRGKKLFSANALIDMSDEKEKSIKKNKRFVHKSIHIDGVEVLLRDQRPISEKALAKCLTDGWGVDDFLFHLNNRVFMWSNLRRLTRHFNRYVDEEPIIFRFSTSNIIEANPHVKFARLNTGATRANSYLGGKAPERGPNTFQAAKHYEFPIASVAEVTFEKNCIIAGDYGVDLHPDGNFMKKTI